MTSRDFCYWLQGYFEINFANMPENMKESKGGLTNHQAELVRRHLAMVFKHEIDPSMGGPEHQKTLDAIHDPPFRPKPAPCEQWTSGDPPNGFMGGGTSGAGGGLIRC